MGLCVEARKAEEGVRYGHLLYLSHALADIETYQYFGGKGFLNCMPVSSMNSQQSFCLC